ncbi:MAG: GAF domain-containing protein [Polyangiaceae bacterium]
MIDRKGKGRRSDRPPVDLAAQLKLQRDSFVSTFFKKGAEFTEELVVENDRLRGAMADLERENAALRTQLASDEAIRDLLRKIEELEREKQALLSHVHEAEAHSSQFTSRHAQVEEELANLANLHVASYHLHSTMRLSLVVRHLRELLQQLVGARTYAIWVADDARAELVAIASEGRDAVQLASIPYGAGETQDDAKVAVERAFVTGLAQVEEGPVREERTTPAACLPMTIDDRAVGVIAIYALLPQKGAFVAVDFELFKMLGRHAGSALVGAELFAAADGRIPGVEVFQNISPSGFPKSAPAA